MTLTRRWDYKKIPLHTNKHRFLGLEREQICCPLKREGGNSGDSWTPAFSGHGREAAVDEGL